MTVAQKKDAADEWPKEPAVLNDLPAWQHGQSEGDWSLLYRDWMSSLSSFEALEVMLYRRDVNKYLRSRKWQLLCKLSLELIAGISLALLVSAFLYL
jgi:hypothetical protein